ncbi:MULTISPECIES: YARHG domain-containing protein [Devosia]|uniref:YARHG domain-containing protein n=1 Tax=Devosia equisanguinis TaxID=2490941 RepID=A0A3S4D3F2_9HYPH|nr:MULTISPECIES: YARHG domain-containing protein [Devosia]VDS03458.1 hypothetical protein DEVEQU_00581 [Devosia equisanguinis]
MLRGFVLTLALLAGTGAAMANCYEGLGCDDSAYFSKPQLRQLSCQSLWEVRNMIYQQNGYCFQSDRARKVFSNAGCWINDQGAVKLNVYERKNVATIAEVEKSRGCN